MEEQLFTIETSQQPNWYLISSPVVGQDIDMFVATEGLASGTLEITLGWGITITQLLNGNTTKMEPLAQGTLFQETVGQSCLQPQAILLLQVP